MKINPENLTMSVNGDLIDGFGKGTLVTFEPYGDPLVSIQHGIRRDTWQYIENNVHSLRMTFSILTAHSDNTRFYSAYNNGSAFEVSMSFNSVYGTAENEGNNIWTATITDPHCRIEQLPFPLISDEAEQLNEYIVLLPNPDISGKPM